MSITQQKFNDIKSPKRSSIYYYYDSTAIHRLKLNNTESGEFRFGFEESINPILNKETGLKLITVSGKTSLKLYDDTEKENVRKFIKKYNKCIFIKSLLDICIALDFTRYEDTENNQKNHTEIGALRHAIKNQFNSDTDKDLKEKHINKLIHNLQNFIKNTPFYQEENNIIIAVPRTTGKDYCFVEDICKKLNDELGRTNYSNKIRWVSKNKSVKDLKAKEKWSSLDESGLVIDEDLDLKNKNIILLDDLYQSGSTMHYVAMRLKERGCNKIYGLAIVKSWSNDDND